MYDARIFVKSLEEAQEVLNNNKAVFKGEYVIHDIIYSSKDQNMGIDKLFLRLRIVLKNIWNEKPVIVAIKQTELQKVGKQSIIPIKKEFDIQKDAQNFIDVNYSGMFEYLYEFDRRGWQYDMGTDQVDLEDIEGYFSIEFKSKTQEGLEKLLALFNINLKNVIQAPSVVVIKELLKK